MKIYYNPKLKQLARNLRNNSPPQSLIARWTLWDMEQSDSTRLHRGTPLQ